MQQYTFLKYIHAHKTYTLKQCAPMFLCGYTAKMYITAYMNLGIFINTIDELKESNIAIVLNEILDYC